MKNKRLRTAMIIGNIALVWSVPSLNIFGIIAAILSWSAYSTEKKTSVKIASVMYIFALLLSIMFAAVLLFASGIISSFIEIEPIREVMSAAAALSAVGDVLYIAAAVVGFKESSHMDNSQAHGNGLFD